MNFHVFSLMQWPPERTREQVYASELEQLTLAEDQGYEGVWFAEHHHSRAGIGPSIHLCAAWLSARTTRIRIGTAVSIPPFFHPLRLAEEIAMLDIMSGGRFQWGIGWGDPVHLPDDSSAGDEEGSRVFREQLEILERAWTGAPFSYEGEFFQIPELQCLPTPVQQPCPPVWIAALSHAGVEWAAANDRPVWIDALSPVHRIEERRRIYREAGEAAGHDVSRFELPVLRHVYVGETMRTAREEAGRALLRHYRSVPVEAAGLDPEAAPDAFLDWLFENCAVVGDAAYCRDRIAELSERTGLDSLVGWQNFGDLPHPASLASQRRLIEKVAPALA